MNVIAVMNCVRDNFCRKVAWVAARHPLMKVMHAKCCLAVDCGLASDTFNSAVWLGERVDADSYEGVRVVARHFERENRPVAFWVWDRPGVCANSLFLPAGFVQTEVNIAMWANAGFLQGKNARSELVIQPVRTLCELVAYGENLASLFSGTAEEQAVREYHAAMLPDILLGEKGIQGYDDGCMRLYTGSVEGRIVTTGLLFLAGGTAGIYDIATREDARRQGFGAAMFHFLLNEGKKAGASSFVLQASPDGLSIYKRAGFQAAGNVLVFERRTCFSQLK